MTHTQLIEYLLKGGNIDALTAIVNKAEIETAIMDMAAENEKLKNTVLLRVETVAEAVPDNNNGKRRMDVSSTLLRHLYGYKQGRTRQELWDRFPGFSHAQIAQALWRVLRKGLLARSENKKGQALFCLTTPGEEYAANLGNRCFMKGV
jgi:hypothetical protein